MLNQGDELSGGGVNYSENLYYFIVFVWVSTWISLTCCLHIIKRNSDCHCSSHPGTGIFMLIGEQVVSFNSPEMNSLLNI